MNLYQTLAAVGVAAIAAHASASVIQSATYRLHNHPDGSATSPSYGLRLDELYNATSGHDIFTFDFADPASYVTLNYTGTTITIQGQAWGGRDEGSAYAAEATTGLYTFHFEYTVGVDTAAGDDDIIVIADMQNFGWISTPTGDTIDLTDKSDGSYSFRLGNEDNDLGHRGFAGISGWGWLVHGPQGSSHVSASDWLFTVGEIVPAPASLALLAFAPFAALRRRR
jgi:hypothetical protein